MSTEVDLWTEASRDLERENLDRALAEARVAAADVWSFLAVSKTGTEYANRKALVEDRLDQVAEAASSSPAEFSVVRAQLEQSFDEDFARVVASNRQARKRYEAQRKMAGVYCKTHNVWVGDENESTHTDCKKEQRATEKTKDAASRQGGRPQGSPKGGKTAQEWSGEYYPGTGRLQVWQPVERGDGWAVTDGAGRWYAGEPAMGASKDSEGVSIMSNDRKAEMVAERLNDGADMPIKTLGRKTALAEGYTVTNKARGEIVKTRSAAITYAQRVADLTGHPAMVYEGSQDLHLVTQDSGSVPAGFTLAETVEGTSSMTTTRAASRKTAVTKRTDELQPGDKVKLPGGLIRTVDRVESAGYETIGGEIAMHVHYVFGDSNEWSGANSANPSSTWEVVATKSATRKTAADIATDGACGLSWDDSIITSMTPAPSARCPFEPFHEYDENDEPYELEPDDIPSDWPVQPVEGHYASKTAATWADYEALSEAEKLAELEAAEDAVIAASGSPEGWTEECRYGHFDGATHRGRCLNEEGQAMLASWYPDIKSSTRQATAVTVRPKHTGKEKRLEGWVVAEVHSPTSSKEVETFPSKSDAVHFAHKYAAEHGYMLHAAVKRASHEDHVKWLMRQYAYSREEAEAEAEKRYEEHPEEKVRWEARRKTAEVVQSPRGSGQFRIEPTETGSGAVHLDFMPGEDHPGYGVWERVYTVPIEQEAREFISNPPSWWGEDNPGEVMASRRYQAAKRVARTGTPETVDGFVIDRKTAVNLMRTYAALSPENRRRFDRVPAGKLTTFANRVATKTARKKKVESGWLHPDRMYDIRDATSGTVIHTHVWGSEAMQIIKENPEYEAAPTWKGATRRTAMENTKDLIGKGLLGFPGSEITAVSPIGDDWAGGSPLYMVTVKTNDGRELQIPKNFHLIQTFDRKGSRKQAGRLDTMQRIVQNSQAEEIDGMLVDIQSANLFLQGYNIGSENTKKVMEAGPIDKVFEILWKSTASRKQGEFNAWDFAFDQGEYEGSTQAYDDGLDAGRAGQPRITPAGLTGPAAEMWLAGYDDADDQPYIDATQEMYRTMNRKTAQWVPDADGAEDYEAEGVGEGRVRPDWGTGSDQWTWDAFTYDALPERGGGTANSVEEAKKKVEDYIAANSVGGVQNSMFGKRKTAQPDTIDVEICVDCLFFAANGEVPEDRPDFLEKFEHFTQGYILAPGDGEGFFSHSQCDTCGSTLGGDRFDAALIKK